MTKNSTTWTNVSSTWCHGQTKVIRVPEVLAEEILDYARRLDASMPCNNGNIASIVEEFIEFKRSKHGQHHTQKIRSFKRDSRSWDVFNEFCEWLTKQSLL